MNDWKRWIIAARYWATLPIRQKANRRREANGESPICVLFYHRVADDHPNAWTISNAVFERQINWIRDRYEIISLEEAQRRLRNRFNSRTAVCITFDDGYADNCTCALPFLIKNQIPCTYFVSLGNVLHQRPFPHDEKAGQPLLPNTLEQLRHLAKAGIEIGAHTRTHPDLGLLTNEKQLNDEIVGVKRELEDLVDTTVRRFAFPFGMPDNISDRAVELAVEAGYEAICSAYGGYNLPGDSSFHLRRIHGDPCCVRLKNWLSFDPRKIHLSSDCIDAKLLPESQSEVDHVLA